MATPQRVIKQSIAVTGTGERVTYTAQMVHRYNLSGAVWKSVEYAQAKILDVIDGGRAMARDGVQIAKDLEILTGSSDGGRRVKGRWGRLAPDSLLEKRTTLIAETKGYGTFDFAKMKEARKEAMSELRKEGWVMGQEAKQYYQRLGAAGADYRALRVERTETQFMLKDEAQRDAGAAGYAIKWTLVHTGSPDDDCDICRDYAHGIVGGRQVGTKDGVYRPADLPEIPHPNCDCIPQPVPMPEELARPVK
jgi:hypothetical protein